MTCRTTKRSAAWRTRSTGMPRRRIGELGSDERKSLRERMFKALTDKGTDPRGIRRPTRASAALRDLRRDARRGGVGDRGLPQAEPLVPDAAGGEALEAGARSSTSRTKA